MNIFSALKDYKPKYELKEKRAFSPEEIAGVQSAIVKPSQYGFSVCFIMKSGIQHYMPVSRDTNPQEGQTVDLTKAKVLTLVRDESEIYRIEF